MKERCQEKSSTLKWDIPFNIDVIIWGDVISGTKDDKEIINFKLFFTYKVPIKKSVKNFAQFFSSDVEIALVNRDWNIYEINSLKDTKKISNNLSEMIMFICGLIYCQFKEYAEESVVILEQLLKQLSLQTKDENIFMNEESRTMNYPAASSGVSPPLKEGELIGFV